MATKLSDGIKVDGRQMKEIKLPVSFSQEVIKAHKPVCVCLCIHWAQLILGPSSPQIMVCFRKGEERGFWLKGQRVHKLYGIRNCRQELRWRPNEVEDANEAVNRRQDFCRHGGNHKSREERCHGLVKGGRVPKETCNSFLLYFSSQLLIEAQQMASKDSTK